MTKFIKIYLFLIILFGLPASIESSNPDNFPDFQTKLQIKYIQRYHGVCAVATDFSHFIRLDGEICRLKEITRND